MKAIRYMFIIINFFSILVYVNSETTSEKNLSNTFQYLASVYCFIDDYPLWLKEQIVLDYLKDIAQYFYIDMHRFKQDLERSRLQKQCLKAIERFPILIGGG
ncbi:unnamed protein product [Adineta steineri]|uniref:Uncharacterized protein n=1 Tax=Adineta steineri TaxID=433720 RepID=A0A813ZIE6_9BILA|nr:unnamed protein product [Adineta steineri]CAF3778289.1 unnamed protein product [Adineta steineri]